MRLSSAARKYARLNQVSYSCPLSLHAQAIQFKAHSKYQLYDGIVDLQSFNSVNLLATASTLGLLITGRPTEHEIQGMLQPA